MLSTLEKAAGRQLGWAVLSGALVLGVVLMLWKPVAAVQEVGGDAEVLLLGKASKSIRASVADLEKAKAEQAHADEALLWVRRGGQEYVIRDAETLEAARAMFARQAEIALEQKEIGAQQREIGRRQKEIGREQQEVGRMQRAVGIRRQTDRAPGEPDQIEPEPGPRGGEQRRLKAEQDKLEAQQSALDAEQQKLGARMEEMGAELRELGRGLEDRFRALADEALAKGLAQPTQAR